MSLQYNHIKSPHIPSDLPTANSSSQGPTTNSIGARHSSPGRTHQSKPSPSCLLCRHRKIRCDRGTPCANCVRANETCVPFVPSHAPRGRKGGRRRKTDGGFLERLTKLEGLVKDAEGVASGQSLNSRVMDGDPGMNVKNKSTHISTQTGHNLNIGDNVTEAHYQIQDVGYRLNRYLGTSFWTTLSQEISGLREVLNSSSGEETEIESEQTPDYSLPDAARQQPSLVNHSTFLFPSVNLLDPQDDPTPHQVYTLCDIYITHVDPMFKVLHTPSLRQYLQERSVELDCSPGRKGLEALRFAIYYAATVSMTAEECRRRTGNHKELLMSRYRARTELGLAKADFVNTVEISTLQALTILLASLRVNDTQRLVWTLTALAVRIAQAMSLHNDNAFSSFRPFEREMRRRLWWQICILDSRAAEDRATNPIVPANTFSTRMPLHVNDKDLSIDSREGLEDGQEPTDMTFCLMCHETIEAENQLKYTPLPQTGQTQSDPEKEWAQRIDTVVKIQRGFEEKYLRHLNLANPFHWTIRLVADINIATMWLFLYRPLQKHPGDDRTSRLVDPGILSLAVTVLEGAHQLDTDPIASPYRWLTGSYVQWHALAVTIAELCTKLEGPMVERAWAVLVPAYREASRHVADSQKGMLWRPIQKLMSRAQRLRQNHLNLSMSTVDTSTGKADLGLNQQPFQSNTNHSYVQEATNEAASHTNGPDSDSSMLNPAPFDWDPWLSAASMSRGSTVPGLSHDGTNEMAWYSWENYLNDLQGQEAVMMSGLANQTSEYPTCWP